MAVGHLMMVKAWEDLLFILYYSNNVHELPSFLPGLKVSGSMLCL